MKISFVSNLQQKLKLSWSLLFIVFVATLFFPLRGISVGLDSTLYIAIATSLSTGQGYVDASWAPITNRGPIYPALLALSFQIFGLSVESASYVVRLFFVGNLAVVYWAGRQFYNHFVGIAAAILVLTSTVVHLWSAKILLDNVMPFFILLSNLILFIAIKKDKLLYYIISGLVLGLGFLVKDIAGLYIVTPAVLWVIFKPYRKRKNIILIIAYMSAFLVCAVPWLAYSALYQGNNYFATIAGWVFTSGIKPSPSANMPISENVTIPEGVFISNLLYVQNILRNILEKFIKYYQQYFAESFSIAPIFVAAWAYLIYHACRYRQIVEIYLIILFALFTPLMLFLARTDFRAGQTMYIYLLSYLALAYVIGRFSLPFSKNKFFALTLFVFVLSIQLFQKPSAFVNLLNNNNMYGYSSQARAYTFSFWQYEKFHTSGSDSQIFRDIGEWLQQNIKTNEVILSDNQWLKSHYFYLAGRQPIYEIEYVSSQLQQNIDLHTRSSPLFIWTQAARTDPSQSLSHLWAFSEPNFLSQVKDLNAKYVILGRQRNFLSLYLRSHPDFVQVAEFHRGNIQIFTVVPDGELEQLENFPLFVSDKLKLYLNNLRNQGGRQYYESFKQKYFLEELQVSDVNLRQIETGSLSTFKHVSAISHKQYASILAQKNISLLSQAISVHRRQIADNPDNLWLKLSLTYLYQTNGQHNLARLMFIDILSLAEVEPLMYPSLIELYGNMHPNLKKEPAIQNQFIGLFQRNIEHNPDDIHTYWQLAEVYQLLGVRTQALATYDNALAIWPQSAGTRYRMAKLYQSQSQYKEALFAYRTLLALSPDEPNLPEPAKIHLEIGKILFDQTQRTIQ